ncbi:hypothetical protein ACFSHQ_09025 [Gemmobacter lanyuensis]
MTLVSVPSSPNPARRLIRLCALFCLELLLLAAAYQFFVVIECHLTDVNGACRFLRSLVARALVVFAVGASALGHADAAPRCLAGCGAAGWGALARGSRCRACLACAPLGHGAGGNLGAVFDVAIWFLGAGAILAGVGVMWVAPAAGGATLPWLGGGLRRER